MQFLALKTMQGIRQESIQFRTLSHNSVSCFLGLVDEKIDFKALFIYYNNFTDSLRYVFLFKIIVQLSLGKYLLTRQ